MPGVLGGVPHNKRIHNLIFQNRVGLTPRGETQMGMSREEGVDILIGTQQFGQEYTTADGAAALSSGDYIRLNVTIAGTTINLLFSTDEAETVGLELARAAGRLRRIKSKAAGGNPIKDYLTTAFRTDPK